MSELHVGPAGLALNLQPIEEAAQQRQTGGTRDASLFFFGTNWRDTR